MNNLETGTADREGKAWSSAVQTDRETDKRIAKEKKNERKKEKVKRGGGC